MVAIAPFRALRFAPGADLAALTSPPHDCMTPAERDAFMAREPHSIVRVVLGPEKPGDAEYPEAPNRFQRAADDLAAWQRQGVLVRDERPAFYMYEVTRTVEDAAGTQRRTTMTALLARLRVDPSYQEVRPHERILPRRKRDRLSLRQATRCDTEPIWLLYRDARGWVNEILASNAFDELARFTDEEGHEHRLWRVDRAEAVAELTAQFDDRTLVIADGHHRYQTAVDHAALSGRPQDGSILVALVRDNDPGVAIEATHRLLHGLPGDPAEWLSAARKHWDAEPVQVPHDTHNWAAFLAGLEPHTVGLFTSDGRMHVLRLKPGLHPLGSPLVEGLAVSVAHEWLLRRAWGVDPAHPEGHLSFSRDAQAAVEAVRAGRHQAVVLLSPERVDAVLEVAQQGHLMPQKATFFVPKLRSGVVMGPLDEPLPQTWREVAGDGGKAEFRRMPL